MNTQQLNRWEKTGILKGCGERSAAIASCLDKQLELNKHEEADVPPLWLRASIPVVRRVFGESKVLFENDASDEESNFYVLRTLWNPPHTQDINEEASYTAKFSAALMKEINETFGDLKRPIGFNGFSVNDDSNGQVVLYYI